VEKKESILARKRRNKKTPLTEKGKSPLSMRMCAGGRVKKNLKTSVKKGVRRLRTRQWDGKKVSISTCLNDGRTTQASENLSRTYNCSNRKNFAEQPENRAVPKLGPEHRGTAALAEGSGKQQSLTLTQTAKSASVSPPLKVNSREPKLKGGTTWRAHLSRRIRRRRRP